MGISAVLQFGHGLAGVLGSLMLVHHLFDERLIHLHVFVLGSATLLHATNVLLAFAFLVGFLHIAVDDVVRRRGRRTAILASLTVSAELNRLSFHHYDLAALLELATRDRAQARLHISVQRLRRNET